MRTARTARALVVALLLGLTGAGGVAAAGPAAAAEPISCSTSYWLPVYRNLELWAAAQINCTAPVKRIETSVTIMSSDGVNPDAIKQRAHSVFYNVRSAGPTYSHRACTDMGLTYHRIWLIIGIDWPDGYSPPHTQQNWISDYIYITPQC